MAKKYNFSGLNKQFGDSMKTKEAYSSASGASASKLFDTKVFGSVPFLKMKKGENYILRFVPYVVDESHPKVKEGKLEKGDYAYVLDFTQHAIGPNNTRVVCPRGTYGHPCPVCDKAFALRKEGASKEETDAFKASRRVLYNVVLSDDPSKVYILSESHFLFEKEFLTELDKGDDNGEEYNLADFCVGATEGTKEHPLLALKIKVTTDKLGTREFNRYSFKVVKYTGDVDESVLDEAVPLHKALIELKPTELETIMYGAATADFDEDEEDEDDIPRLVIGKPDTQGKDLPKKRKKADEDEDEEDEDLPKRKKASAVYDEADDDDDEDEEEETPSCPSGYEFGGKRAGFEDECDDCPYYSECRAERKRRKSLA